MAHLETWYRCPTCNRAHDTQREAAICRNTHPVREELWAVGSEKSVRVGTYGRSAEWALQESDLSDTITERKEQLKILEGKTEKGKILKFEKVTVNE